MRSLAFWTFQHSGQKNTNQIFIDNNILENILEKTRHPLTTLFRSSAPVDSHQSSGSLALNPAPNHSLAQLLLLQIIEGEIPGHLFL